MTLRLTIENMSELPDGGPLSYTLTGRRGIDIGRDAHLDWVLPDPSREVSGKHCEIRWREGGYWLHDVSSNGTYLNGAESRLAEPRRLRAGDRLEIGRYLIAVDVEGEGAEVAQPPAAPMPVPPIPAAPLADLWGVAGDVAPPQAITRERKARPVVDYDFIDAAADVPAPVADLDWARPKPVETPEPAPLPALLAAPEPAPERTPPVVNPPAQAASGGDFLARFEAGAGLPPGALAGRAPEELAQEIGKLMLLMTAELKALLQARAESKGAMRSAHHTSVQALDNNPIPFAPTPEEALRLMLARQSRSYLNGEQALRRSFASIKSHQSDTFAAMQAALDGILAELDPATIERDAGPEGGVGQLLGARKSRLWDAFRTRWMALASSHAEGLRGVFMNLFTSAYDKRAGRS